MEENYTPLNYTKLNLADFNTPQLPDFDEKPAQPPHKKFDGGNVFLVVAVLAFVFSISYYVQSSRFQASSQASSNASPTGMMMPIDEKTLLPRAYNDEDIAPVIIEDHLS